jgi:CheY-like chemotaxis protein/nitrogen-specific signal transduction histidine kinase
LQDVTKAKHLQGSTKRKPANDTGNPVQMAKWKEGLIAKMSHEMRTPVSEIMGMANLLLESDHLHTKHRHLLQTLKKSSNNLLLLVEDLFDYALMEQGDFQLEKQLFSLSEVMDSVRHHFSGPAADKDLQILFEFDSRIPNQLIGDPAKLGQALKHLLSNAVKFSHHSTIYFEAAKGAEKAHHVDIRITVADHGTGLSKEKLQDIKRGFHQIEQTHTVHTDIGLGLSMVKLIVDKMGGEIQISSQEGEGTTVQLYLSLPVATDEGAGKPAEGKKPEEINVLVAEDNEINQMLLKENLRRWKFNFNVVNNGQKALQLLKTHHFDLALVDVQMPVLNGLELTQIIRNKMPPEKRDIPILALTAHNFSEDREKCIQAGMNDYIAKPFAPAQLFHKIARLTGIKAELPTQENVKKYGSANIDTELLDPGKIRHFTRGNTAMEQRLVNRFLADVPGDLQRMIDLKDAQDWSTLFELIHRLKPTISMMGIKKAEAFATQLNEEMRNSRPPQDPDTINQFVYAIEQALPELKKVLSHAKKHQ